jgi:hypothetical protein
VAAGQAGVPRVGATLSAGAAFAPLGDTALGQWGVGVSAGPTFELTDFRLSAELALDVFPALRIERGGARVRYRELQPALLAHAQVREGDLWLGAHTGFALSFADARGERPRVTPGSSDRLPAWTVGVDATLALGAGLGVSLGVDLQVRMRRQRYAIDGDEVADLGRLRPLARLALTWTTGAR